MDTLFLLKISQIVLSFFLVGLILIQGKGGGLSSSLNSAFSMYRSKRGFEKFVFIATVVLIGLLVVNSLGIIILS